MDIELNDVEFLKEIKDRSVNELRALRELLEWRATQVSVELDRLVGQKLIENLEIGKYYCKEGDFGGGKYYFKFTESFKVADGKLEIPNVIYVHDSGAFEYLPTERFTYTDLGSSKVTEIPHEEYFRACVDLASKIEIE